MYGTKCDFIKGFYFHITGMWSLTPERQFPLHWTDLFMRSRRPLVTILLLPDFPSYILLPKYNQYINTYKDPINFRWFWTELYFIANHLGTGNKPNCICRNRLEFEYQVSQSKVLEVRNNFFFPLIFRFSLLPNYLCVT